MLYNKIHFFNILTQTGEIPESYRALNYAFNNAPFYKNDHLKTSKYKHRSSATTYTAFPNFLSPTFNTSNEYIAKKIIQKKRDCYGIIINPEINNISQYINNHFSKNSKTPILRKMKRLEMCFDINYEVYYGAIEKEYYNFLMDATHAMLIKRFEQRNSTHFILKDWQKYIDILFPLINQKKASLFVIYNNKKPIQVSINFHFGKTLFAYIPSYNIDYGQFGLGNTAIYKQLEWCIENKYEYLDMGNGDLEYKKRWCNFHYELETHIYFRKSSIIANIIASLELNKIKLINLLKDVKSLLTNQFNSNQENTNSLITDKYLTEEIENVEILKESDLKQVNLESNYALKDIYKSIYDFLYTEKEHLNSITVYKIINEKDAFLIKGINKSVKLVAK
jgi:hypothetical protein